MSYCFICCRVYKNFDPRAAVIRKVAEEVFEIQGRDPLIDIAIALEKAARADDYFVKRQLYPNVDFYSGTCSVSAANYTCTHGFRRWICTYTQSHLFLCQPPSPFLQKNPAHQDQWIKQQERRGDIQALMHTPEP